MDEMTTLSYEQFVQALSILKNNHSIVSMEFHKVDFDLPFLSLQDNIKNVEIVSDPYGPDNIVITGSNSELSFLVTDSFGIEVSDYQAFLSAGGQISWVWINSDQLPYGSITKLKEIQKGA